jgi:hypothetical protein
MAERSKHTVRAPDRLAYKSSEVSSKPTKKPRKDNAINEYDWQQSYSQSIGQVRIITLILLSFRHSDVIVKIEY